MTEAFTEASTEALPKTSSENLAENLLHLTITAMAYGGKGLARIPLSPDSSSLTPSTSTPPTPPHHEGAEPKSGGGKVYFVEGAVPGDEVIAQATSDEGRYGEAEIVQWVTKSSLRTPPVCPVAEECGGCQWMGIDYREQLGWKEGFVTSALRRIGKLGDSRPVTMIGSPDQLHYRNRILVRAHWQPNSAAAEGTEVNRPHRDGQAGRLTVGYFARGSRRLVPISTCAIAAKGLNQLLTDLQNFDLGETPAFKARIEMQEVLREDQTTSLVVTVYPAEGPHKASTVLVQHLRALPYVAWAGLVFELGSAPTQLFDQDLGLKFLTIPGQFQQINLALNRTLRRIVLEKVQKEKAARILDVCCGSGNLSLPLADGVRYVEAIESNKKAIVCGHRNLETNQTSGLRFLTGDSEKHLWKVARSGERFDLVILDPPRQGLYRGMVPLKLMSPRHIIYVSCDPTTLARDIGYLCRGDAYEIESVTALDFFPNTYHVETVLVLKRTDAPLQDQ